jgi:DNA topoisomerase I
MSTLEDRKAANNQGRVAPPDRASGHKPSADTARLLKRLGLTYVAIEGLSIRRLRRGRGFRYVPAGGTAVSRDETKRFASLAVPPAYEDVFYAADPSAHLQAVGRDAAGRLQYRYHPWQRVRETRKARRLARLAEVLPQIRRSIGRHLGLNEPTRAFVLSAIIEPRVAESVRAASNMHGCVAPAARRPC